MSESKPCETEMPRPGHSGGSKAPDPPDPGVSADDRPVGPSGPPLADEDGE